MLGTLGADLVERWQDAGPLLWVVAGALVAAWLVLLGALAATTEPRRVRPGAATLELAGDEPPAVVNLVTSDWELGHEALPATLIDLAARGHVSIDHIGDRTLVRARTHRGDERLTVYEQMVFDPARRTGAHTDDGFVPGDALTTGPEASAKGWWKRFAREVHHDARSRGLSAPRWSAAHRVILIAAGLVAAVSVALAASTIKDDPDDDDDPATLAQALGGATGVADFTADGVVPSCGSPRHQRGRRRGGHRRGRARGHRRRDACRRYRRPRARTQPRRRRARAPSTTRLGRQPVLACRRR